MATDEDFGERQGLVAARCRIFTHKFLHNDPIRRHSESDDETARCR